MAAGKDNDIPSSLNFSRRIARLLDRSIRVPGTDYRVGLDGIIGLIPGVGDVITTGLGSLIVVQAASAGVPAATLMRMLLNMLIDFCIGAIPVVGDIADFFWHSNSRNVRLWEQVQAAPQRAGKRDTWLMVLVITAVAGIFCLALWLAFTILVKLLEAIQ